MTEQEALSELRSFPVSCLDFKEQMALDMAINALEKQIAKKQGNIDDYDSHLRLSKAGFVCCSATNKEIRYPLISLRDLDYCPRCGQKLDSEV